MDLVIDVPVPGELSALQRISHGCLDQFSLAQCVSCLADEGGIYLGLATLSLPEVFLVSATPAGARRERIPVGPTQTAVRCADGEGGVMVVPGAARSATRKADLTSPPNIKG